MKKVLNNDTEMFGTRVRIVRNLMKRESPDEFPEPLKWAVQLLLLEGERWREVCRIDNYPHRGKVGSHVHEFGKRGVTMASISFQEARTEVKRIGRRVLLNRFGVLAPFGDDEHGH